MRIRSPIERMVDAACGVTDEMLAAPPPRPKDPVLLTCACGAKLEVERQPDFFDFDVIETECPECRPRQSRGTGT